MTGLRTAYLRLGNAMPAPGSDHARRLAIAMVPVILIAGTLSAATLLNLDWPGTTTAVLLPLDLLLAGFLVTSTASLYATKVTERAEIDAAHEAAFRADLDTLTVDRENGTA